MGAKHIATGLMSAKGEEYWGTLFSASAWHATLLGRSLLGQPTVIWAGSQATKGRQPEADRRPSPPLTSIIVRCWLQGTTLSPCT